MNPPISRLSADCVSLVASFLDTRGLLRLKIAAGLSNFGKVFANSVLSLQFDWRMNSIDLYRFLTPKRYPNLQELVLHPADSQASLVNPPGALPLPPKLTSLSAVFNHAPDIFCDPNLITEPLNELQSLLLGGLTNHSYSLSDFRLFPNLSSLKLLDGSLLLNDGEIASLPRTLTELCVRVSHLPKVSRYEWPTEMTILRLTGVVSDVTLEWLPRTLTDLCIDSVGKPQTMFRGPGGDIAYEFPWRAFFPFLVHIQVQFDITPDLPTILRTVLSPNALDSTLVDAFISSGFWDLPALRSRSDCAYPLFETVILPFSQGTLVGSLDLVQELAPFLTRVKYFMSEFAPPLVFAPFLPSLARYHHSWMSELSPNEARSLPSRLEKLSAHSIDTNSLERLSNLKELLLHRFNHGEEVTEPVKWPPKLTSLELAHFLQEAALSSLPTSLTKLDLHIECADWPILASFVGSLKRLKLIFASSEPWMTSSEPLAPMLSTNLESVNLTFKKMPQAPQQRRFLEEFIGPKSPFPTSLKELTLIAPPTFAIPLTICPYLPRQLESFECWTFLAWSNPDWLEEPHVAAMSPAELLSHLPPNLKSISINTIRSGLHPFDPFVLHALPPSLIVFTHYGSFELVDSFKDSNVAAWLAGLPPKLAVLKIHKAPKAGKAYLKARRPELQTLLDRYQQR